jgi:hypothetical protein
MGPPGAKGDPGPAGPPGSAPDGGLPVTDGMVDYDAATPTRCAPDTTVCDGTKLKQCLSSGTDSFEIFDCSSLPDYSGINGDGVLNTATNPTTCAIDGQQYLPIRSFGFTGLLLAPAGCRRSKFQCVSVVPGFSQFDYSLYGADTYSGTSHCQEDPGSVTPGPYVLTAALVSKAMNGDFINATITIPPTATAGQTFTFAQIKALDPSYSASAGMNLGGVDCTTATSCGAGCTMYTNDYNASVTINALAPAWSVTINATCTTNASLSFTASLSGRL